MELVHGHRGSPGLDSVGPKAKQLVINMRKRAKGKSGGQTAISSVICGWVQLVCFNTCTQFSKDKLNCQNGIVNNNTFDSAVIQCNCTLFQLTKLFPSTGENNEENVWCIHNEAFLSHKVSHFQENGWNQM